MGMSKPKKQAAPPKPAAPVKRESEEVRTAEEAEIRRGISQKGRQASNLLQSNYGSTNKTNLLG